MVIHWVPAEERPTVVERLRHAEGKDCNAWGDVRLYRLPHGDLIVVEQ